MDLLDTSLVRFSEKLSKRKSIRLIETQETCTTKKVSEQTTNNNNKATLFEKPVFIFTDVSLSVIILC